MKDIVIKGKDIVRELYVYLLSFVVAFVMNIAAVIIYDRPLIELVSQIGYVVFISIGIYFILLLIRLLIKLLIRLSAAVIRGK